MLKTGKDDYEDAEELIEECEQFIENELALTEKKSYNDMIGYAVCIPIIILIIVFIIYLINL